MEQPRAFAAAAFDAVQLQSRIDTLGLIGEDEEGVLFRPVYGRDWLAAREQLREWMAEAGLDTRTDAVGNLFGRLPGSEPDRPVVLTGSHIDTVRNGGRYDGALGVHAGLAALAAISAAGAVPVRSLEVVALCEEEGSRFPSPMWGSQAILGLIEPEAVESLIDVDGVTMAQAMRSVGLDPADLPSAVRTDVGCFVELHIEQGGILERGEIPLGVVSSIAGQRHLLVCVEGVQNHAGTTPMDMRSDALTGAAEMVLAIEDAARRSGPPTVATVGRFELSPGSRNVVPGRVEFTVDLRSATPDVLEDLVCEVRSRLDGLSRTRSLRLEVREDVTSARPPVAMDPALRRRIGSSADALGIPHQQVVSGAGHDSQLFATRMPTAMLFVPSAGGISHSPVEHTPIELVLPCVAVLTQTLWELANAP